MNLCHTGLDPAPCGLVGTFECVRTGMYSVICCYAAGTDPHMKTKITQKLLASIEIRSKPYRIHDTEQPGLFLRIQPSGRITYMVTWARNRELSIGRVGYVTLAQARTQAARCLAEAYEHGQPLALSAKPVTAPATLGEFILDDYMPWFEANHKGADKTRHTLMTAFPDLLVLRLPDITARHIEEARLSWIKAGNKPSTTNRKLGTLSGVLSRAVEWQALEANPITAVKKAKEDQRANVRYLSPGEAKALRSALERREQELRLGRASHNKWLAARKLDPLPAITEDDYADHMTPMVLLSLNTGIRRGELFNLKWAAVDLVRQVMTIEGAGAKTSETRHVPLNPEALAVLEKWGRRPRLVYVFPGRDGKRMTDVKTAWQSILKAAGVSGFRWHDMRHDFASRLVMAGVPLNTVRELLGHSDIKMTLRYAHLAPSSMASAVNLLNSD